MPLETPLVFASQVWFEKNSSRKAVLAVLFNVPEIVTVLPATNADVITGKFWRLLGPVSTSQGSFGVTPSPLRSIPSAALEKIEF